MLKNTRSLNRFFLAAMLCPILFLFSSCAVTRRLPLHARMKALIIDGQNNHKDWAETSRMMKGYLEETGLFAVDIATTPPAGGEMDIFHPDFSKYRVVISNYNGEAWSTSTQQAFEGFVRDGGGFVCVHAADNAFPQWLAYNQMIGLGGWGGRQKSAGPYVYYYKGELKRDETMDGQGGYHGKQREFAIEVRDPHHPIMRGLPDKWLHVSDELYESLRGPAHEMTILATAYSDPAQGGNGRDEPMAMTVAYGQGRVFQLMPGHSAAQQRSVDFITLLQRGAEWAARGDVTQKVPKDFPTADQTSSRMP